MNYTNTSNHQIRGMIFEEATYAYMDPNGMPSGGVRGDWTVLCILKM